MQVDLHGQVALVTGAAQGIGRSIADTLARNGARIVYTDLDIDRIAERSGFGTATLLRHHFRRVIGVTPSARYRSSTSSLHPGVV